MIHLGNVLPTKSKIRNRPYLCQIKRETTVLPFKIVTVTIIWNQSPRSEVVLIKEVTPGKMERVTKNTKKVENACRKIFRNTSAILGDSTILGLRRAVSSSSFEDPRMELGLRS